MYMVTSVAEITSDQITNKSNYHHEEQLGLHQETRGPERGSIAVERSGRYTGAGAGAGAGASAGTAGGWGCRCGYGGSREPTAESRSLSTPALLNPGHCDSGAIWKSSLLLYNILFSPRTKKERKSIDQPHGPLNLISFQGGRGGGLTKQNGAPASSNRH